MQKYLTVFTLTIKEYFVYRLNFILWRFRMFLSLLITFFLWNAVYDKDITFANYSKPAMLSYIIFANIISNFVLGTRTSDIAGDINDGHIINYLLKPLSFFRYFLTRDLADKFINVIFVFIELTIVIILFKPPLLIPNNILTALLFLISGTLISFFISLMLSFIGFWTTEVWAPRFLFIVIVNFISGSFFPLDLLPSHIYQLLLLTPFPYLFYLPTKILINQHANASALAGNQLFFSFFWLFITWKLAAWMWIKGNKNFSFWGR